MRAFLPPLPLILPLPVIGPLDWFRLSRRRSRSLFSFNRPLLSLLLRLANINNTYRAFYWWEIQKMIRRTVLPCPWRPSVNSVSYCGFAVLDHIWALRSPPSSNIQFCPTPPTNRINLSRSKLHITLPLLISFFYLVNQPKRMKNNLPHCYCFS